jgi:hypothetical protein
MLKFIGCLGISFCIGTLSYAQQAVSSTDGNGTGLGGAISYTSGQTSYNSSISNSGTVPEGIKLPFEIQVVTKLDEAREITLECEAYPNPVTDFLILRIGRDQFENMKYQLIDPKGKVLEEAFIGDAETNISLKHYKPTNYFLKVMDDSREVMTFKITKTDQLQ